MTSLDCEEEHKLYRDDILLGGMLDLKIGDSYIDSDFTRNMIDCVRRQFIDNTDNIIVLDDKWKIDSVDYFGSHIVSDFNLRCKCGDENLELWMKHPNTLKYYSRYSKLSLKMKFDCNLNVGNFKVAKKLYKQIKDSKDDFKYSIWDTKIQDVHKYGFLFDDLKIKRNEMEIFSHILANKSVEDIDKYLDREIINDHKTLDFTSHIFNNTYERTYYSYDDSPQSSKEAQIRKYLAIMYTESKYPIFERCVRNENMELIEYLIELENEVLGMYKNIAEICYNYDIFGFAKIFKTEFKFPTFGHKLLYKAIKRDKLEIIAYIFAYKRYRIHFGKFSYSDLEEEEPIIAQYIDEYEPNELKLKKDIEIYHKRFIKKLLSIKFDFSKLTSWFSELYKNDDIELLKLMIPHTNLSYHHISDALTKLCEVGETRHKPTIEYFVKLLIKSGKCLDSALYMVTILGYYKLCVKLVDAGANIADCDLSTISVAYHGGYRALTKYLVNNSAESDGDLNRHVDEVRILFLEFIENDDLEMLEHFAETGAFDMTKKYLMQEAVKSGQIEIVKYLSGFVKLSNSKIKKLVDRTDDLEIKKYLNGLKK